MKTSQPTIVCGTDFSDAAIEAAQVASAVARRFDAKLLLVHVNEEPTPVLQAPAVAEASLDAQRSELDSLATALRSSGVDVEATLIRGDPRHELVALAQARQAKLIVVAAVGRSRRLLTGSVAVRIAETSPVPTLVVRQGERISQWAQRDAKLQIVLGYDFSAAGDAALGWVRSLMAKAPCELNIVHVNWPPADRERLGLQGPVSLTQNDPELQRSLEFRITEMAHTILGENAFNVSVLPGWGRIDCYLTTLACGGNTDLLILGSHQRPWLDRFRLGSISRAVLSTAPVSVLIVPPTSASIKGDLRISEVGTTKT